MGTHISPPVSPTLRACGQTLWACHTHDAQLGLAWDWVQIGRGVVAMADPMSVVTNLRLVGDEGEVLNPQQSARHIFGIVHALPWQDEVARALDQHQLKQLDGHLLQ